MTTAGACFYSACKKRIPQRQIFRRLPKSAGGRGEGIIATAIHSFTGRARDPGERPQQAGGEFVICYRTYRTKRPPICHCTNTRTMEPPAIRGRGDAEKYRRPMQTAQVKKRTRNCKNVFPGSGTHGPIYGANLERISRGKRHITQIITTLKKAFPAAKKKRAAGIRRRQSPRVQKVKNYRPYIDRRPNCPSEFFLYHARQGRGRPDRRQEHEPKQTVSHG